MSVFCPSCQVALPPWSLRPGDAPTTCPACFAHCRVTLFPALFRRTAPVDDVRLAQESADARCYEHSTRRAAASCTRCGRFICTLCEVSLHGASWCPECLGQPAASPQTLVSQRTLYDSIALSLVLWPMALFFYPSLFTAPVVVYLAARYWKSPSSLIPRRRWRMPVALFIALLQIAAFGSLIVLGILAANRKI